jgi:hypothetical protein
MWQMSSTCCAKSGCRAPTRISHSKNLEKITFTLSKDYAPILVRLAKKGSKEVVCMYTFSTNHPILSIELIMSSLTLSSQFNISKTNCSLEVKNAFPLFIIKIFCGQTLHSTK